MVVVPNQKRGRTAMGFAIVLYHYKFMIWVNNRFVTAMDQQEPPRLYRNSSIAALVPKIAKRAIGKYGLSQGSIFTRWNAIVGVPMASHAIPEKLTFPRRQIDQNRPDGATLVVRVAGAFIPELTHRIPEILARINGYFGYKAVTTVKIKPMAWGDSVSVPAVQRDRPLTSEDRAKLEQTTAPVADPALRSVLIRLGRQIVGNRD